MPSSRPPASDDRAREFLRLLGEHERRLRGFILALVPHWADADDIAQEVRLRLWEQFDDYDPAKDFGAWARTIARYQVLTHREKRSRRRELLGAEFLDLIAHEAEVISEELDAAGQALKDCFKKLPEAKQQLLMNYYGGERTTRQIAAESGRSFDATRQTILRTRLALRDCIEEALHGGDGP